MAAPSRALLFPERVGRYELLLPIGSGGVATVYLAREDGPNGFAREVALKLLHLHLRDVTNHGLALFDEARLVARIKHPHVVQVLDVGHDPYGPFLSMNYVEGDTLGRLMHARATQAGKIELGVLIRVLSDALLGLQAAHEAKTASGEDAGLVHRDFTPQNILVGIDGIAQLTDFGVAKAADRLGHTRSGFIKGKVRYMSPEQARGGDLDRTSDVWAAGVIAWEVFAGRRLFPRGDEMSTLLKIVSEPAPRLRSILPECPAEIDEAIASALEQDAAERCPTAALFRERLLAGLAEPLPSWQEVGAAVSAIAGERLADLRRRCRDVAELRARMGTIVREVELDEPSPEFAEPPKTEVTTIDPSRIVELPEISNTTVAPAPEADRRRSRWPWTLALGALLVTALGLTLQWTIASAPETVAAPDPHLETSAPSVEASVRSSNPEPDEISQSPPVEISATRAPASSDPLRTEPPPETRPHPERAAKAAKAAGPAARPHAKTVVQKPHRAREQALPPLAPTPYRTN
jgi:eukaryotic-like serine/threonine-protein kinase